MWDTGMSFSRRVGIPYTRVQILAQARGYELGEMFFEKFQQCEGAVINFDLERIPKGE